MFVNKQFIEDQNLKKFVKNKTHLLIYFIVYNFKSLIVKVWVFNKKFFVSCPENFKNTTNAFFF